MRICFGPAESSQAAVRVVFHTCFIPALVADVWVVFYCRSQCEKFGTSAAWLSVGQATTILEGPAIYPWCRAARNIVFLWAFRKYSRHYRAVLYFSVMPELSACAGYESLLQKAVSQAGGGLGHNTLIRLAVFAF